MTSLSTSEIDQYESDGILIPSTPLSNDVLADLRDAVDSFLSELETDNADFIPNVLDLQPDWIRFAQQPEILGPVTDLIGDNVILWGSGLFCKSATGGKATPWHQDGQYWPIRPLATVSAWIAFDPVDTKNGCLRVIPGSHKPQKLLQHAHNDSNNIILNQELPGTEWQTNKPRDVQLKPGQFSLHDVYMIHGANPNNSGRRRGGLVFRYMPASSIYDRDLARRQAAQMGLSSLVDRKLHLVSGVDVSGKNDIFELPG
ncbi:MAG: phytanoyl-CoA dioxygenase family protein [Burkholderiaceae bacterium]